MKTLVLDHPRISSEEKFNDIANTPLWSCLMGGYVAAALETVGAVRYVDFAVPGARFAEASVVVLQEKPELLAVNSVYFWEQSDRLFAFFSALREQGFSGHLNLFGFFPSLVFAEILKEYPAVDSIAVGECEYTLRELAEALQQGDGFSAIPGLATRGPRGTLSYQPRTIEKNPDRFAFPIRAEVGSTVTILASRGCYNRCSFCLVPPFDELHGGWRGRSPENIFEEVKCYHDRGVTDFYFSDPNFIGPGKAGRERLLRLLEMLSPLRITFGMETRPNDLDDEVVAALVGAGLTSLLMGVESGSAAMLKAIKKHASTVAASDAIALCRRHGIDPEIGFLMFLPDCTVADLTANFNFLKENELLTRLDRTANLLCHKQIVLRGTAGYTGYAEQGRLHPRGIFGFEGEIEFLDQRVAQLARVILAACHQVLRATGEIDSPIYWQNPDPGISGDLNSYLGDLFTTLLEKATKGGSLGDIATVQNQTRQEIGAILARGTAMPPLFR